MTRPTARLDSNQPEVREAAGHVAHTQIDPGRCVNTGPGSVTERRTQMAPVPTKALGPALPRQEQHDQERPESRPRKAAPMLAAAPPVSPTIDRSACPAPTGNHGTAAAYSRGCRCPDARAAIRRYRKFSGAGMLPDYLVDGTGLRRRLQALAAVGWSADDIADRLGWTKRAVQDARLIVRSGRARDGDLAELVVRDKHDAVRAVYADMIVETPARPHRWSITWAAKQGWMPPGAWDDIDDPAETPDPTVLRAAHEPRRLAIEDVEWLASPLGGSHDDDEIARHYGVTVDAVQACRRRAGNTRRADPRRTKLTDADAHAIRAEYLADPDGFRGETVAARYGITGSVVSRLITGKTRAHLGLTDLTARSRGANRAVSPGGTTREENAA